MKASKEVKKRIRDQEKTAVSRAEGRLERLEQEINDLRRRDAELEQLSHTQDHIQFLQSSGERRPQQNYSLKQDEAKQTRPQRQLIKAASQRAEHLMSLSNWSSVHETLAVMVQDHGVFPEEEPTSYDQGHAQVSLHLGYMEEALFLVPGSCVRSSLSSRRTHDRYFSHEHGSGDARPLSSGSVEEPSFILAHKFHGNDVSLRNNVSLRAVYILGYQDLGADILSRQGLGPGEWRLHPEVVERIWGVYGQAEVDLFVSQDTTQFLLLVLPPFPPGAGCYGTDMAEATSADVRCTLFPQLLCSQ
ncbi:hypothetical protein PO909_002231 [Leuciscus waleckii]